MEHEGEKEKKMAKEYIDRKAAVAALFGDEVVHIQTLLFAQKRIEALPAAEVAEVVRCKDCEYSVEAWVNEKGFLICPASGMDITGDDYCSYGVKMEGDGE